MPKKKILLSNEFSLLCTGFSTMGLDLLSELHNNKDYEVAELASYVSDDDPRINQVPWKVYPVIPSNSKPDELSHYRKPENYLKGQFGSLRLEDTILDFKPDVIIAWRDYWHNDFIAYSPYRNLFRYAWSACVDSEPPDEKWLDTYSTCDVITSYTQWGLNVIKNYGRNNINVSDIDTMPGVNTDIFKPLDKQSVKKELGLSDNTNIVLSVMRNQPRKLIPNLICSFMNFLDKAKANGHNEIVNNTYLYIHTGIPDVGWDIPKEILRYNASHKVLLTYICDSCGHFFVSFFRGERCHCYNCGKLSAHTCNTSQGLPREQMAKIYNACDLYVQYSICEGCGIPILEAKSCGLPTITVDYSAPYELARMGGSFATIPLLGFKQEGWAHANETGQFRGIPDDSELTKSLYKYFKLTNNQRKKLSKEARDTAIKYHDHKLFVNKWIKIIDSLPELDQDRWFNLPKLINIDVQQVPWNLEPISFVRWCCAQLPPKHYMKTLLQEKQLLKSLVLGYDVNNPTIPVNRKTIFDRIKYEINKYNHYELHRYNKLVLEPNTKKDVNTINYRIF